MQENGGICPICKRNPTNGGHYCEDCRDNKDPRPVRERILPNIDNARPDPHSIGKKKRFGLF